MKILNKVALITGSGSGMGRATAILFSREGAKIAIVDIDNRGGQETSELIRQKSGEAIFIQADVSKASDVKEMIKVAVHNYGRIDILFNNAGIPMPLTPIEEVKEDLWDKIMHVNLKGVFLGCKYVVPIMKKQEGGVIINTASVVAVRPRPGVSAYTASKGAVISFSKGLALELAPYKIRVNCINPVATDTPMLPRFIANGNRDSKESQKAYASTMISTIPLGRLALPEDIAQAALYLASDDSSMVTGSCINVDGGRGI